ncbi:MAG: TetR/AcrR family transcriptional regulator [Candidatus Binatia bacterium]
MATPTEASPRPDGRQLRSSRTREAVARAMLALLEGGNPRPTAREVAAQAGVSERAVFRHFEDLEGLLDAVSDIHVTRIAALAPPLAPPEATPGERLDCFIERWCEVHEMITPVRRAAQLRAPFSATIRSRHAWMRGLRTRELRAALDPRSAGAGGGGSEALVAALGAVVSWSFWEQLRAHQRLSKARAVATVRLTIESLLTSAGGVR